MAELKNRPKSRSNRRQPQPVPSEIPAMEPVPTSTKAVSGANLGLEEYCLSLVVANPRALAMANEILEQQQLTGLTINDFNYGVNKEIFKAIQLWTAAETPKIDTLVDMVGESLEGQLATIAALWHGRPLPPTEQIDKDLSIAILRLRLQNVIEQMKELDFLQQEAKAGNDTQDARQYMDMAKAYIEQRKKLEQTRDALSLMGQRRSESKLRNDF